MIVPAILWASASCAFAALPVGGRAKITFAVLIGMTAIGAMLS
jgi:hypothetical protein